MVNGLSDAKAMRQVYLKDRLRVSVGARVRVRLRVRVRWYKGLPTQSEVAPTAHAATHTHISVWHSPS